MTTSLGEICDDQTQLRTCAECGRGTDKLKRKKCHTCYTRELRGGTAQRRIPLDPEIAELLLPVPGTSASFAERVFTYVDASGDCWEWTGATSKGGYGVIGRGGRRSGNIQAHRAMWELLVDTLPEDLQIDHLCRNHGCVNPDHLEPVTMAENKRRGFSVSILYAKRKTCDLGHPLDGRTRSSKTGRVTRYCKACKRDQMRASHVPAPPRTHCNSGKHPWIEENIYVHPKTGKGSCRPCKIERQREMREAAKQAA